jgi:hypothetical protein
LDFGFLIISGKLNKLGERYTNTESKSSSR